MVAGQPPAQRQAQVPPSQQQMKPPAGPKPEDQAKLSKAGPAPATQSLLGMQQQQISTGELHFNEDPHSIPEPLSGGTAMTSTQVRYKATG